jgi:hypothetical protein
MTRWLGVATVATIGCGAWALFEGSGARRPPAAPSAGSTGDTLGEAPRAPQDAVRLVTGAPPGAHRVPLRPSGRVLARPGPGLKDAMQAAAMRAGLRMYYLADWNLDGSLGAGDLVSYLSAFDRGDESADLTRDGVLDVGDIAEFVRQYGVAGRWSTEWC